MNGLEQIMAFTCGKTIFSIKNYTAEGGKIRFHPFNPFHPFSYPVALEKIQ